MPPVNCSIAISFFFQHVFTIFHNPHEPKDEEKTNDARIEGMQTCLFFHVIQLLLVKNTHKSPCVCNFFSKFQWKNSPQKSRRNHPRMERKRLFFLSPSHLHRTSSPDQVRELERKPPLHRLGVDSMQVGPNFRLQTLRSLMKSWYIPFNCPKHAFFRGCFTWMINQPFTWKNGSTLGFQVITTVLIPYKSTPINHL